jgi:hypothetical protein
MDLNARRKMIRTDEGGGYEVSSDGSTVWVNEVFLVARFCQFSREYVAVGANDSSTGLEYAEGAVTHPEGGPSSDDWIDFVNGVKGRWGIVIGQKHTPLYIQRAKDVGTTETSTTS